MYDRSRKNLLRTQQNLKVSFKTIAYLTEMDESEIKKTLPLL